MHFVLQQNVFKEDAFDTFKGDIKRLGISFSVHKVMPFVGTLLPLDINVDNEEAYVDPVLEALNCPVICMGSFSLRHAAKRFGWTPGVFNLLEAGDFDKCLAGWGEHMLNHDSEVVEFRNAKWPRYEQRFIRPTDDSKYFAGMILEGEQFEEWQDKICRLKLDYGNSLQPTTMIQVNRLKKIFAEYRVWVVKGKVVTKSLYKLGSRVTYENYDNGRSPELDEYVEKVLGIWAPHETMCLDVCETEDGWKIVETNTLNHSGFYAANTRKLVEELVIAYE